MANHKETLNNIQSWGSNGVELLRNIQLAAASFARDPSAVRASVRAYHLAVQQAKAATSIANKIKTEYAKILEMQGMRPLEDGDVQGNLTIPAPEESSLTPEAQRYADSIRERWGGAARLEEIEDLSDTAWFALQQWLDKRINGGLTGIWTPEAVGALGLKTEDLEGLAERLESIDGEADPAWLLAAVYVDADAPVTIHR